MQISINTLNFECIIGILDFEREQLQKVLIDCEIDYTYNETFLNYAEVAAHIQEQMIARKFELLEEALLFFETDLKHHFPLIETLKLTISKPDILKNATVSLTHFKVF